MLKSLLHFTQNILDPISIWIGIILAFPVLWTWYELVWGRHRRRKRWIKDIQNNPGKRPAILIVDLLKGDKSIRPAVEGFRQEHPHLKNISDDRIFVIELTQPTLEPKHMPIFVDQLREKAKDIYGSGTDALHLFYGGPCILATLVGREFANACQVVLYQYSGGQYVDFGPLNYDLAYLTSQP